MAISPKSDQDSPLDLPAESSEERYLEGRSGEDLAEMLTNLENNNFIPVEALVSVAEILTYLYDKDSESAPAESKTCALPPSSSA